MMKSHFLKIYLENHPLIEDLQKILKSHEGGVEENLRWTEPQIWHVTLGRVSHPTFNKKQQKAADEIIHAVLAHYAPIVLEFTGNTDMEYRTASLELSSPQIDTLQKALQEKLSAEGYKFIYQKPRITIAIKTSDFNEAEKKIIEAIGLKLKHRKYDQSLKEIHRISGSTKSATYMLAGRTQRSSPTTH